MAAMRADHATATPAAAPDRRRRIGRPGGAIGNDYGGPDWVCPTGDTAVSFGDTWGAPRGGLRHEGVDDRSAHRSWLSWTVSQLHVRLSWRQRADLVGNDGTVLHGASRPLRQVGCGAGGVIACMVRRNARFRVPHSTLRFTRPVAPRESVSHRAPTADASVRASIADRQG